MRPVTVWPVSSCVCVLVSVLSGTSAHVPHAVSSVALYRTWNFVVPVWCAVCSFQVRSTEPGTALGVAARFAGAAIPIAGVAVTEVPADQPSVLFQTKRTSKSYDTGSSAVTSCEVVACVELGMSAHPNSPVAGQLSAVFL